MNYNQIGQVLMVVAVNVLLSPFSYIEIEMKNKTFLGMALLFLVKRMRQVGFSLFSSQRRSSKVFRCCSCCCFFLFSQSIVRNAF